MNVNASVNFVDENNVVVGYDLSQQCCEEADYYFAVGKPTLEHSIVPNKDVLLDYRFDTSFYETIDDNAVSFKLKCPYLEDLYLVLYNNHNGYYSHGFDMKVGNMTIKEGAI